MLVGRDLRLVEALLCVRVPRFDAVETPFTRLVPFASAQPQDTAEKFG